MQILSCFRCRGRRQLGYAAPKIEPTRRESSRTNTKHQRKIWARIVKGESVGWVLTALLNAKQSGSPVQRPKKKSQRHHNQVSTFTRFPDQRLLPPPIHPRSYPEPMHELLRLHPPRLMMSEPYPSHTSNTHTHTHTHTPQLPLRRPPLWLRLLQCERTN